MVANEVSIERAPRGRRLRRSGWLDRALTHDFCPWANRYVYWLKQPIGWFVLAAAMSLLVGCFLGPQGFVLCAAILCVILLGVVWPWIAIRAVRCSLHFDLRRAREGDTVEVRLQVANRFPWPVWGLAIERGFLAAPQGDDSRDPLAVALAHVPGWSVNEYSWEFRPEGRGVYPTEPPLVSCGFPFGIWVARRPLAVAGELIVWPRTVRLSEISPMTGHQSTVAALVSRQVGNEGDVLGVRPFRQGDSLRHVHWAQTARHDQLIVCERQTTSRRTVRVLIDAESGVHFGCGAEHSLEWCIRIGASLCQEFVEHYMPVELSIGAGCQLVTPGVTGIRLGLDLLARFVPHDAVEDRLAALPHDRSRRRSIRDDDSRGGRFGHMTVVVTTDRGWKRLAAWSNVWVSDLLRGVVRERCTGGRAQRW